jgi:hypothetical protein
MPAELTTDETTPESWTDEDWSAAFAMEGAWS